MARIPRVEKINDVEVGRLYLVNTVTRKSDGAIIPIHGSLHEDSEIIDFPDLHWHIDWRFIGQQLYDDYLIWGGKWTTPWAWPINKDLVDGRETRRRMRCKRLFGPYVPPGRIPWLKKLEDRYQDAKMRNFICPHKGLPCNGTPIVDGVVVCRGHGLAFNVETGSLVRQNKKLRNFPAGSAESLFTAKEVRA